MACAREEMPPGTGPDFEAPQVVEMFPAHGSAVPDLDEDAFIRFSEPIGDPRSLPRLIETSPAWIYEINAGRRNVRIRPQDGWRPGVVYTFRIPPGLRDLVRNMTREPIEILFTTGSEFAPTEATGVVWDRESVRKMRDVAVHVIGADSVPYAAVSDTGGNFALAGLPVGEYWAFAFRDQNRNRIFEREFEPHDSALVSLTDSAATAAVELWLTAPDSTAPLLGLAEARDSLRVRLEFDDLLEPDAPLDSAVVRITRSETGEPWPVEMFVVGDLPMADSTASEAPEDSAQAAPLIEPEPAPVAEPALEEESAAPEVVPERARPQRFVNVLMRRPLVDGEYDVHVDGFRNLRLLSGGGDTTMVYETPPPPEEEVPAEGLEEEGPLPEEGEETRLEGEAARSEDGEGVEP
jgi:hypothetical protein